MHVVILAFLIFIGSSALADPGLECSPTGCEYYKTLESKLQCGPNAYLQQEAYPMCFYYQQLAPYTEDSTQTWLPNIRICLQVKLQENFRELSCDTLSEVAIRTHVDCYIETGYCQLPLMSKLELTFVTLPHMINPIWRKTAELILRGCQILNYMPESEVSTVLEHNSRH